MSVRPGELTAAAHAGLSLRRRRGAIHRARPLSSGTIQAVDGIQRTPDVRRTRSEECTMYHGQKVIDVHGHMSTPPHFRAYAYNLVALRTPSQDDLFIPDELMETALARHLKMLDENNIDLQMISP